MQPRIHVRTARTADLPHLAELQRQFVEGHCGDAWAPRDLKAYLEWIRPLDPRHIEEGTVFVAGLGSRIVGCASWSYREEEAGRRRLPGRRPRRLDPAHEPARLEAFLVEPEWLKGAGLRLLAVIEYAARVHGFARASMRTCPDGAARFEAVGYTRRGSGTLELPGGEVLPVLHLERSLATARLPVRPAA